MILSTEANASVDNISQPKENEPEEVSEPIENSESEETSELFENVYLTYVERKKSISFENVKTYASTSDYIVEIANSSDALF